MTSGPDARTRLFRDVFAFYPATRHVPGRGGERRAA